ncbi:MAG: Type 1 glutamine amidotransferase-like domain-containing protein [Sciscionella sp.]
MSRPPQILAVSGVLDPDADYRLDGAMRRYAVGLVGVSGRPTRVCFLPTAAGDDHRHVERFLGGGVIPGDDLERSVLTLFDQPSVSDVRAHLLGQDLIWCGGGSVVNQIALWRAHRLDEILWDCWQSGVVLAGQSAGSLCWHRGGVTDSFRVGLDVVTDLLGWLPFSNGVHDDLGDQPRRAAFRSAVARGDLGAGFATEDGVGLLYTGTELSEAVSVLDGSLAWYVEPDGSGGYQETVVEPRRLRIS